MGMRKKISVSFYSIQLHTSKDKVVPIKVDWRQALTDWNEQPLLGQKIGDLTYHGVLALPVPAMGIHSPTSGDFRTEIDLDEWKISDAPMDDAEGSGHLIADPTAVVFLERASAIAIARSNASAPGSRAVYDFVCKVLPPETGTRWVIRPIVEPGRVKEFQDSQGGIDRFTATLTTNDNLLTELTSLDGVAGPHVLINQMAEEAQAELKVKIEVSLADQNHSRPGFIEKAKRFAGMVRRTAPALAGHASRADVHYLDASHDDVLNLVNRNLSVREEIVFDDTKPKTFTSLLAEVVTIASREEDRVIGLMGGGARAASS